MQRIEWVDDYVERLREFVFVRPEDNVLIKRPNQAHRMNPAAIRILDRLFNQGESIARIVEEQTDRERVIEDLAIFFRDLRCLLTHGLDERHHSPGVRHVPFDFHFSTYPILSEIAVTYRCNLKCKFCYAGCNCTRSPNGDDRELNTAAIFRILDILRHEAKVPSVSFTGGEPTLRADLPDLVRHARALGMRVNLITNGAARGPDTACTLIDAGLNSVQVSVEGTHAEVHDAVTGVPGSFDHALRTVDAFREAGAYTHINTTLNQLNLEDALGIPALARRLGLERFSMNMMIPAGTGTLERELVIPYAEIGYWIDRIQKAARREGVEFMWYSPTPLCLFNPIARGLGNKGCAACDGLLSVAPNGDVLPCSSFDEPVGNLLTDGFDAVWFGARARSLRDKSFAHPACRACEHFAPCQGACPLYWREMGYDELPAAETAVET